MLKTKRTQIKLNPSVAEILAAPPGRPRASNNTNNNRHKATYDLRPETIQAVRDLAEKLGVPVYAVAQKLLEHALSSYQAGQLELRRRPVTTTWRLE